MRQKPRLVQIETQARVTLALLPHVAALPFVNDEAIVKMFGSAMATLNWLPTIPILPEIERPPKRPRTQEEKRAYWRGRQRVYRARRRVAEMDARERGLAKLTPEERSALKLPPLSFLTIRRI